MDSATGVSEGDEQEDSSSSNHSVCEATEALDKLEFDNEKKGFEDELAVFRQQWKRELQSTPSPQKENRQPEPHQPRGPALQLSDEEKAKQLFICGVELERGGKLYEAIQHYKRAIQILPDVEARLYEGSELRADTPEEEYEIEEVCQSEQAEDSDDEVAVEGEELVARLQRILARKGHLFQPQYHTKSAHISWLPYEVVRLVLRWVVGAEMDAGSLERAAASCRGLYVAAREPDLWRTMCVKTWGLECGTPRAHGYANWRHMYIERPRLNLNGCYISKTTYLRHGEHSFQDHSYRPWYLIDYYRYLRFFPEGLVLMWTTAEEPASCVGQLKYRETKTSLGIMSGHYRLVGDTTSTNTSQDQATSQGQAISQDSQESISLLDIVPLPQAEVVILIKKAASEKTPATNSRFRARRKEPHHEQVFQLELQVRSVRSRRNWQLVWRRYAVSTRRDQWSAFELAPSKFPPFAFSTVRNYTAEAHAPLQTCA